MAPACSRQVGYLHIDIAEVQTAKGKLQLFVAIDRTCKLAYAELHTDKKKMTAVQFLRNVIAALPYKIYTILTDNGAQFTHRKQHKPTSMHSFDRVCYEHNIEHRLTKINHPWTNGQVEHTNRTIKEATTKTYHYDSVDQLKIRLNSFMNAYNYARKLSVLKRKIPYEAILTWWHKQPKLFNINPFHLWMGSYTYINTIEGQAYHVRQIPNDQSRYSLSITPILAGLVAGEASGPFCGRYG